ncbi:hypothetical protein L2E82_48860 [Cichorium intybus]|uniref:Uncharacterized protein n=1 Tax=Cichorium intybus TaxID=13427 RepID=A0ACB8Z330_CICIN|nr:hypothetical protein L2E82_48860 [Cichorium intybus]
MKPNPNIIFSSLTWSRSITTVIHTDLNLPAPGDRLLPSSPTADYSLPAQPPPPLPTRLHQVFDHLQVG